MSSNDDKTPQLIAVASAFLALVVFSVAIRIFTRLRLVKWLGADDWMMVCALIGSTMLSAGTIASCKYGMGKHLDQQPPEDRKPYMIADLIASLSYSISAMFVKLSLLTFYVRLTPEPHFRMMTYTLMGICAVFGIGSAVTVPLQCIPISMLWDTTVSGHCIDINNFYFANAGIHMFTEILIFALPIRTLWHLHLPLRQKLGLCGLMSIGVGLIVISCYRISTIRDLITSHDITYDVASPITWYIIEVDLAIFIACGPSFLAFCRHYLPAVFGGSSVQSRQFKGSYPLSSAPHGTHQHTEHVGHRSGTKTTVTTRARDPYFTSPNESEEMIIMSSPGGIQKQVDVWVSNEDADAGKAESRSNAEEIDPKVDQRVG